jgi:hypothetical protein
MAKAKSDQVLAPLLYIDFDQIPAGSRASGALFDGTTLTLISEKPPAAIRAHKRRGRHRLDDAELLLKLRAELAKHLQAYKADGKKPPNEGERTAFVLATARQKDNPISERRALREVVRKL